MFQSAQILCVAYVTCRFVGTIVAGKVCRGTGALKDRVSPRNKLLQLVPEVEIVRLSSIAEAIELRPKLVLHHWRLPMDDVYFLETGLVSVSAKVGTDRFVTA